MFLAAFLFAQVLSHLQPVDAFDELHSVETKKRYEAYTLCFAQGVYDRRQDAGSPEAHMQDAKAACRNEYDSFVASVVKDSEGSFDATSAAIRARSFLDEMDMRAIIGPPAPAKLAQLPVERLVGDWRMGDGSLVVDMKVHFTEDGSLVGIMKSDFQDWAGGLASWKVTSNGTKEAVFHASFIDGRLSNYDRFPSLASEMDFVNSSDKDVQRFDLMIEDSDLLLRWVGPDGGGGQLRFRRQIGATNESKRD